MYTGLVSVGMRKKQKNDETIVGLIGIGYDEDGVSGYINPLMIDEKYQGNGLDKEYLKTLQGAAQINIDANLVIALLEQPNDSFNREIIELYVSEIHIGHRKTNAVAGKLYESLRFVIFDEDETDYFRSLDLNQV